MIGLVRSYLGDLDPLPVDEAGAHIARKAVGNFVDLAGLATLLLVRPLDAKRSLFAAFFFLTALWLVVGNTSRWDIAESRVLYRMALCLSVPVLVALGSGPAIDARSNLHAPEFDIV